MCAAVQYGHILPILYSAYMSQTIAKIPVVEAINPNLMFEPTHSAFGSLLTLIKVHKKKL